MYWHVRWNGTRYIYQHATLVATLRCLAGDRSFEHVWIQRSQQKFRRKTTREESTTQEPSMHSKVDCISVNFNQQIWIEGGRSHLIKSALALHAIELSFSVFTFGIIFWYLDAVVTTIKLHYEHNEQYCLTSLVIWSNGLLRKEGAEAYINRWTL